jgi:hypothetical protein
MGSILRNRTVGVRTTENSDKEDAPSFEPTVLKWPAEKPPVKAPCNRLRPFSSRTYSATFTFGEGGS